ncbi:hypothetical protein V5T82_15515 [Magnetovibrio sp. PR-2]|uniref:hypothetical protein n=1 Tax=Magnetovibrio sp. PR-2 TaxID=3120356 RepID=UPI002FCE5C57
MFQKPSLMLRIAIGKGVGFLIGLIGLITLPYFVDEAGWMIRFGVLFWYATVGAVIGVYGVFTHHPVLHLPLPWWVRAPIIGAWMNFVLTLFVYEQFAVWMVEISTVMFGSATLMTSPFWFVLEGALVGLLIGYLATRFGGEGKETVGR